MITLDKRTLVQREVNPINSFTHAIIEQAVADLVTLRLAGLVTGWEVMSDPWPRSNGNIWKVCGHYRKAYQAKELIEFFTGGYCTRILNAIDSEIDGDVIMKALKEST